MEPENHTGPKTPGPEGSDANVRDVIFSGLGVAAVTLVICLLMLGLFRFLAGSRETAAPANPLAGSQIPPEPRLEVQPWEQLKRLRAHEDEVLNSYGWVDKSKGIVHIPIGRAIDIVAQQGLPTRQEAPKP